MVTGGSLRLPPKISAIGPLAQATTAGTSSATAIRAPGPNTASGARRVKPMPKPPISTCGFSTASIFLAAGVASAASEPLRRLFISSLVPSMMENSAPRRISRNSPSVPGTLAVSILTQGIMRGVLAHELPSSRRRPGPIRRAVAFQKRCLTICRSHVGRWLMGWTAPYGISCARMRLLQISDKGAVREPDYPHWNGYVEAFFSAAWGRCGGAGGVAQATWAQGDGGFFCRAAADRGRDGGLRRGALLGTGAWGSGPPA